MSIREEILQKISEELEQLTDEELENALGDSVEEDLEVFGNWLTRIFYWG